MTYAPTWAPPPSGCTPFHMAPWHHTDRRFLFDFTPITGSSTAFNIGMHFQFSMLSTHINHTIVIISTVAICVRVKSHGGGGLGLLDIFSSSKPDFVILLSESIGVYI